MTIKSHKRTHEILKRVTKMVKKSSMPQIDYFVTNIYIMMYYILLTYVTLYVSLMLLYVTLILSIDVYR
jgi:hypothetical protein